MDLLDRCPIMPAYYARILFMIFMIPPHSPAYLLSPFDDYFYDLFALFFLSLRSFFWYHIILYSSLKGYYVLCLCRAP